MQDPNLPVLIVTDHDNYLYDSRLSQADGYVIKSHFFCDELKESCYIKRNESRIRSVEKGMFYNGNRSSGGQISKENLY